MPLWVGGIDQSIGVGDTITLDEMLAPAAKGAVVVGDGSGAPQEVGPGADDEALIYDTTTETGTKTGKPTPADHTLGGARHTSDTLANLSAKLTDATLGGIDDTAGPGDLLKIWSADQLDLRTFTRTRTSVAFDDDLSIAAIFSGFGDNAIDKFRSTLSEVWKMGEASGNAVGSLNGTVLTDINTVGTIAGKSGNARDFDGINERFDGPTTNPLFDVGTGNFLISLWVRTDASGTQIFVEKKDLFPGPGFQLRRSGSSVEANFFDSSGLIGQVFISGFVTSTIHHVVLLRDSGTARIYLDNAEGTTLAVAQDLDSTRALTIGANIGGGQELNGFIDEMYWWKAPNWADAAERNATVAALFDDKFYENRYDLGTVFLNNINAAMSADDTGAADLYVVTMDPAPASPLVKDLRINMRVEAGNTNTGGAATVDVNGTIESIKLPDGTDPVAGDIVADEVSELQFDGTDFELLNPKISSVGAPHTLGGASHTADTLANLNAKINDANLDDSSSTRTPAAHNLGGAEHSADTLANLNAKISDANLIDTADSRLSDARTPTAHSLAGAEHNADTLANLNSKISDATLGDVDDTAGDGDTTKLWSADKVVKHTILTDFTTLAVGDTDKILSFTRVEEQVGANTVLMLHMDGTDGATSFPDSGPTGHTVTANGDAQVDTSQSKFGGASCLFDGTGDFLSLPDSDDWTWGTGDFTVDGFVRFAGTITQHSFLAESGGGSSPRMYYAFAAENAWTIKLGSTSHAFADPLVINTWYHIAVTRESGTVRVFRDGTQKGSNQTNTASVNPPGLRIGESNGGLPFNGWIDEMRITKGEALWTSNFTPPTLYITRSYNVSTTKTTDLATLALDNLASVAINISLTSDTDITDDLGTGDIRWRDIHTETVNAGLTVADTLKLRGRDVDGSAYVDVLTITSANTVTADLNAIVTIGGNAILNSTSTVSALTTVGTIGTGTWEATDVALLHGGTNASLTAVNGGVIYSTATAFAVSAAGTTGQVLTSAGAAAPVFETLSVLVSELANGTDGELITWDTAGVAATVAVGTAGQVLTSNGAGAAPTFQ